MHYAYNFCTETQEILSQMKQAKWNKPTFAYSSS